MLNLRHVIRISLFAILVHELCAQTSHEIQFVHDGKIVYGTFTTPSGTGKFPTVIITPGTGPQDRNGTFTMADSLFACLYPELFNETLQPYKQLSEALVDSGFAVLRYDKLEFTYPPGLLGQITFHKIWLPVESAIEYVKTRSDVDTNCITLLGHSEGSSLIPYIALGRSDIKALISIAGPRRPLDSLIAYQSIYFANACDGDTLAAQDYADAILEYFHFVRVNHGIGLPSLYGIPATDWYDYLAAVEPVSENYNLANLPTLFVGFELDINAPPAEIDRLENEVNITADFWRLPGIIHYMTRYDDPNVSMLLTDTIIHWLKQQQCFPTSTSEEETIESTFYVYPNPFESDINISYHQSLVTDITYRVTDVTGNIILQKTKPGYFDKGFHTLDLHHLVSGIYFLDIEAQNVNFSQVIIKK